MSNQQPQTLRKLTNSVYISWDGVFTSKKAMYTLQSWSTNLWKTIYRGTKTCFEVTGLSPCTCYDFRVSSDDNFKKFIYFKSATLAEPMRAYNVFRAVHFSLMPLLREIVARRPILLSIEEPFGTTPLIHAIETGNLQIVSFLLNAGVDVNQEVSHTRRTPLMFAVYKRELQITSLLIEKGADLNRRDINGMTVLHHAVDSDSVDVVKFVVERGTDVNVQDCQGWTPLMRAVILNCSDELISLLFNMDRVNKKVKDNHGFDVFLHCCINNRDVESKIREQQNV